MQIVLVTGLSGSGKSIAIRQLEDCGYYCTTYHLLIIIDVREV